MLIRGRIGGTRNWSPTSRKLLSAIGGSIGNMVEWYDWYAYSIFALYFARVFFPNGDRTAQLLNAAAIFAVGFIARPVGSWIMGIYADRVGRRAALTLSMLIMGLGSLMIAIAPGYAQVGFYAPVILVLARVLQGLSVGGEYAASATYLSEIAGKHRRGFWSSFQYVTLMTGQFLALFALAILQLVLTPIQLQNWGWRMGFLVGAILAVVALFIMLHIEETESFKAVAKRATPVATWSLMRAHARELATVIGLTIGGTVAFYTFSTYMQKFLANSAGFSNETATRITAASLIVFIVIQPAVGWLSDLVGRRFFLLGFSGLGALLTVPIMVKISETHDAIVAFFLIVGALTILSGYTAIGAIFKAELFPTEIRALGVGLPYAITVSLFGGTVEIIALWCKHAGYEVLFYWYVAACLAVAFLTALSLRETRDINLEA
jgi:MHS family alpha-ketoglutarate permease-like MFS transporter